MSDAHLSPRSKALLLHRSGQVAAAILAYRELLTRAPDDADLLGLLGVATEQAGNIPEAERLLRSSLKDRTSIPLFYRNLNNLTGLLIETGKTDQAKEFLGVLDLPDWPAAHHPDGVQRDAILSLIEAFKTLGENSKALRLASSTRSFFEGDLSFATQMAELLHEAGQPGEARELLAQNFGPNEEAPNLHVLRAAIAFELGDMEACVASTVRFTATAPIFLSPALPTQVFVLAVCNPAPQIIRNFRPVIDHHYIGNYPTQLADAFSAQYRFLSVFPDSPAAADAMRELPRPALVLNNFVNAEKLLVDGKLDEVSGFIDALGVPVLNHPKHVAEVTRQKNSSRFAEVDDIIAPKISRYFSTDSLRNPLIADIEGRYEYPLILRTVFQQMGQGTWLVHNRQELQQALDETEGQQIYLINYVDLRHSNGHYRRIRAAFIDKIWTIIRIDYNDYWNVRGRRERHVVDFYRKFPELMALADRITLSPHEMLDESALEKLDEIGNLMPLDIFGMDFDITDDGRLAIFEANATMNFLANAEGGLTYPEEAQNRMTSALHQLFRQTASKIATA